MGSARRWPWRSRAWRLSWGQGQGSGPRGGALRGWCCARCRALGGDLARWVGVRAVLRAGRGFKGKSLPLGRAPRAQTLAGNAVPEREQALAGPAVRVRLRRSALGRQTRLGRRTGAGNHPLGQANYLPQCAVTYPNATAHPPLQYPAAEKLPPIAYPNARLPIPLRECARRGSCGDSATGIQRYPVRGAVECATGSGGLPRVGRPGRTRGCGVRDGGRVRCGQPLCSPPFFARFSSRSAVRSACRLTRAGSRKRGSR